jgi:hypothetical protein
MAQVKFQMGDKEVTWDMTTDPLIILLISEGHEGEADALESVCKSAGAVTKPHVPVD